jgi:hypothetical protein
VRNWLVSAETLRQRVLSDGKIAKNSQNYVVRAKKYVVTTIDRLPEKRKISIASFGDKHP